MNKYFNIILVASIFLSSCGNNSEPCINKLNPINVKQHQKVVYKDSCELTFFNTSNNDTVIFYAGIWDSTTDILRREGSDCYYNVFKEQRKMTFISPTYKDKLNFTYGKHDESDNVEFYLIKLGSIEYYFYYNGNITEFGIEEYYIQGKLRKNVIKFNDYRNLSNSNYNCYMNKDSGILKLVTTNGNLELIRIKL